MQARLLFAECEEFVRSQNDELYCSRSFAMLSLEKPRSGEMCITVGAE